MSFPGRRRYAASDGAALQNELDWLCDRGVRIDRKGRIIIRLPTPDEDTDLEPLDKELSIPDLMRRDVDRRLSGSRGRRRRCVPTAAQSRRTNREIQAARLGRPAIGDEPRVYVHTTISPQTRATLTKRGLSLAGVFEDCARELGDEL